MESHEGADADRIAICTDLVKLEHKDEEAEVKVDPRYLTWTCKTCTYINPVVENQYMCEMCDTFQPREPPTPEAFGMGDMKACRVFPANGAMSLRTHYYRFNVKYHSPMYIPTELVNMIVGYITFDYCLGDPVDVKYGQLWYTARIEEIDFSDEDCEEERKGGREGEERSEGCNKILPSILVKYDGWSIRWNEWIQVDSPRLEPFRCKTVGDTSAKATRHLHRRRPRLLEHVSMIEQLMLQGFEFSVAQTALSVTGHNLQRAIALLTNELDVDDDNE